MILHESGRFDLTRKRQPQRVRHIPVENVHVDFIAFLGRDSPGTGNNRAASRTINGLSVFFQPSAYFLEPGQEFGLDFPIRHGTDIQQEIGVVSGCSHQILNQVFGAFVSFISEVETPRSVEGLTCFEGQIADFRILIEPGGVGPRKVFFEHLEILSGEGAPVVVGSDERLRLEWLAQGKVAILINPQAPTFAGFRKIGAPVAAVIPQEGGWVSAGSGSVALLNRAAHPNAAKVFLNWLLSKDGGTICSKAAGSQSARIDVPTDFLDPVLVRDPSKKYIFAETEEYRNKQPEKIKIAAEVFKDLLN